jgi:hypothetical protein
VPEFEFKLYPLQEPHEGIQDREIENIDGVESWGRNGYVARFYVIVVKSKRKPGAVTLSRPR